MVSSYIYSLIFINISILRQSISEQLLLLQKEKGKLRNYNWKAKSKDNVQIEKSSDVESEMSNILTSTYVSSIDIEYKLLYIKLPSTILSCF